MITFLATGAPPAGESLFAAVGFSQDPAATFGDSLGVDVPGNTLDDEVEIVSGVRGDCNVSLSHEQPRRDSDERPRAPVPNGGHLKSVAPELGRRRWW